MENEQTPRILYICKQYNIKKKGGNIFILRNKKVEQPLVQTVQKVPSNHFSYGSIEDSP